MAYNAQDRQEHASACQRLSLNRGIPAVFKKRPSKRESDVNIRMFAIRGPLLRTGTFYGLRAGFLAGPPAQPRSPNPESHQHHTPKERLFGKLYICLFLIGPEIVLNVSLLIVCVCVFLYHRRNHTAT